MQIEKTRIKLVEHGEKGELIGFVSRSSTTGKLFGVREDFNYGKKVCVISDHLYGQLKENILYEVELKPMRSGLGYVIVDARLVLFDARIEILYVPKSEYRVTVAFGNKKIIFDPINGRTPSSNTIEGVVNVLESRRDILDKATVIQTFTQEAIRLLERMVSDGVRRKSITHNH